MCDEVTEKLPASHLDHENRTGHGWINAALSASLPISECLNKCQVLKDIVSLSHCNDSAKLGVFLLLQTQPSLAKMVLLDWLTNNTVRTIVNTSGTDISPNA